MTAAQLYKERQESIKKQLDLINELLALHASDFENDQKNYGYAGDLGAVGENLNEIISFLTSED